MISTRGLIVFTVAVFTVIVTTVVTSDSGSSNLSLARDIAESKRHRSYVTTAEDACQYVIFENEQAGEGRNT